MPIPLRTNALFTLELGNRRLDKILSAKTRNEALEMGPWDSFKDWWYDGEKSILLGDMYDMANSPQNFLYSGKWLIAFKNVTLEKILSAVDGPGKSFIDRFTHSPDPDLRVLKKYLDVLGILMQAAPLGCEQNCRCLVANLLLELSLSLVTPPPVLPEDMFLVESIVALNDSERYGMPTAHSLIRRFLLGSSPELNRIFIDGLLNNTDVLSALDRGDKEVVERIVMLLVDRYLYGTRDENPVIRDFLMEFFNNGVGKTRFYEAVVSGNVEAVRAYGCLIERILPDNREPVVELLLIPLADSTHSVLKSAFEEGRYDLVRAMLDIAPKLLRHSIITDLLEDQNEDYFGRALWTGNLTDFNFYLELLAMLRDFDARRIWSRTALYHQRGIRDVLAGGPAKDIQRYQPLILALIANIGKRTNDPGTLIFALENIPVTMLEQAVETVLRHSAPSLQLKIFLHLEYDPAGSLLMLIERLPIEQNNLKKRLAKRILSHVVKVLPSVEELCRVSFGDIWLNNPIYLEVSEVVAFFTKHLIAHRQTPGCSI